MIFHDDIGAQIELTNPPSKIVCLVPSITELLIDLGLADRLVGRTKFCIYPENLIKEIATIGGTKNPNIEMIKSLAPDLVIANKEENNKEDIEKIRSFCPVFTTVVKHLKDGINLVQKMGELSSTQEQATTLKSLINSKLPKASIYNPLKVCYLIWQEPYMSIGNDTYIHDMLLRFGLINIYADKTRYPQVDLPNPKTCDLILLSSEPFPFKEKHRWLIESQSHVPCLLIDGSMVSWYGSRMIKGLDYMKTFRDRIDNFDSAANLNLN